MLTYETLYVRDVTVNHSYYRQTKRYLKNNKSLCLARQVVSFIVCYALTGTRHPDIIQYHSDRTAADEASRCVTTGVGAVGHPISAFINILKKAHTCKTSLV